MDCLFIEYNNNTEKKRESQNGSPAKKGLNALSPPPCAKRAAKKCPHWLAFLQRDTILTPFESQLGIWWNFGKGNWFFCSQKSAPFAMVCYFTVMQKQPFIRQCSFHIEGVGWKLRKKWFDTALLLVINYDRFPIGWWTVEWASFWQCSTSACTCSKLEQC